MLFINRIYKTFKIYCIILTWLSKSIYWQFIFILNKLNVILIIHFHIACKKKILLTRKRISY